MFLLNMDKPKFKVIDTVKLSKTYFNCNNKKPVKSFKLETLKKHLS